MRFDELMQAVRPDDSGSWSAPIGEDWLQGRSAFGGLQVSIALRAMRALLPAELPLRTLQVTFMAPVPAGAARVRAQLLRVGKSTAHVEARLCDGDDNSACLIVGIFGAARTSSVLVQPLQPPVESAKPLELPYVPGITPVFTQHFRMRWLRGMLPFSGGSKAEAVIEVGFRHEQGATTELHLPAIADVIPPLGLILLKKPAPASSMTWTLELLADRWDHQPLQGWRFDAEVTAARDGYTSQHAMIWAPDGTPAALSRQNMVVFG